MARFSATLVDHFTNPRNSGELSDPDVIAFVGNPVCGDQIRLAARLDGETVVAVRFQAHGCAASLAVASLLTTVIEGRELKEVDDLTESDIQELIGGLAPDQGHVASVAADVAHRLVSNVREGASDDTAATCGS